MCKFPLRFIPISALAGLLALSAMASAGVPELFQAASATGTPPPGAQPVRFDADAALALPIGAEASLDLPRLGRFTVVHDRTEQRADGATWVGHFKDYGSDYRVIVTSSPQGAAGLIVSPDGEFSVTPGSGHEWLQDKKQAGLRGAVPADDDTQVPAARPAVFAAEAASAAAVDGPPPSVIDLLLVYTPGMAQRYGAGLDARLKNLVAIANQAYIDSGVKITLRLVHTAQVDYSETTPMATALNDLTNAVGALAAVPALRAQYGADLVQLLRPYRKSLNGCGLAWIGWLPLSADHGYSVAEDGHDAEGSNYYCYDLSLVHELGHNMGASHDRAHATDHGAYDYSYGYGVDGQFATVMAAGYVNATPVGKFSSPELACGPAAAPCGVAPGLPDAADNVLTLNNTRVAVAGFWPAREVDCLLSWAENAYPSLFYPGGAGTQFLAPYTYRHYAGSNAYLGVSAADNHVYYLGPDGTLLDVGDLSGWLPVAGCQ